MSPTVFVDLRCLQDARYRARGIGQHVAALLRTRVNSTFAHWKTVGLVDPLSPKLPDECASWVDEVTGSVNPCVDGAPAVFIDGTPMTHDTRFSLRFLSHPAFLTAAVVYDFIPLDWPGYLPTVARRADYLAKLARLRKFDLFFPISEYTAARTSELIGVPRKRMHVTGAAVRQPLYALSEKRRTRSPSLSVTDPYFVMMSADDSRKNAEVAVKAVRRLNLSANKPVRLKIVGHYEGAHRVVGHYGDSFRSSLLDVAGDPYGTGFLDFCPNVADAELVSLLSGAIAMIAPSYIEGFSLPIVEAAVCGCPVIASTCAAQMELVEQIEALFSPDDFVRLAEILELLLESPALRDSLVSSQSHLAANFHEQAVGERFWKGIESSAVRSGGATAYVSRKLPRLAFLSPFPPDSSGVARFTAMTIGANEHRFSSELYTDAPRPLTFDGNFRDAGRISLVPVTNPRYDAAISVLGNSHFHNGVFDFFERCGGPCILHDARLTQIYIHRLGSDKFLHLAARLLDRKVTMEEVGTWMHDQYPPSLLLEPIIERASPLIVNTPTQQTEIRNRFGTQAEVAVSCPTVFFDRTSLSIMEKNAARERFGILPELFLISSFGICATEKSLDTCIIAIDILRSWKIPAELYFVGAAQDHTRWQMNGLATLHGVSKHVHFFDSFVDQQIYRDFLVGSDAALQLRTYSFGQFSAALSDSISAGLPSVANEDLARSCEAPAYVSTVPDRFSPLQVAEQLALIWEVRASREAHESERSAYLETHNFQHYGKRLMEILGLG